MQILYKIYNYKLFEIILFFIATLYYSFFVNKGLVLFDEGYFLHSADRILNGEIPYKDFSLQYGPVYFYILALFFKLFGPSVMVGRFFIFTICLLILVVTFLILNKLRATSYLVILLSFLVVIAYGFPLINIPNIIWANVLVSLLCTLIYLHWYSASNRLQFVYLFILGFLLVLAISLKQNVGIASFITFNFLMIFSKKRSFLYIIRDAVILNTVCAFFTLGWIYYFFLRDNISGLFAVVEFSKKFASLMSFTLPPLSFIAQPLGVFKLLPYYTPMAFAAFLFGYFFRKAKDWEKFAFSLLSVIGFIVTIYPQSDLLHVYPFFGSVLVSLLLFGYKSRFKAFLLIFITVNILIGFYLTLFRESYRYEAPYSKMTALLHLPRTSGILITEDSAISILAVSKYIRTHTKQNEHVLVYPYAPMLYFIFERRNPTKDPIYYLRTWHFYDDKVSINDMKQKKVRYIISAGEYKFDTELSRFIQKQEKVFKAGGFEVFLISAWK